MYLNTTILLYFIFIIYLEIIYSAAYNVTISDEVVHGNLASENENIVNLRTKRQTGEGKFAEASKTGQMKLLRLWLQLFKNMISSSDVGGMHPLHPMVPKTFIALIKEHVVTMFVPEVGEDPKKQN